MIEKRGAPRYAFRIRRSFAGRGAFAEEAIPRGARIIEYIGRPATKEEEEANTAKYLFTINERRRKMINGNIKENIARFINHSCAPNTEARGWRDRIFIYALRRIKPGEELTYDYGKEYFDELIKPRGCRCPRCTK